MRERMRPCLATPVRPARRGSARTLRRTALRTLLAYTGAEYEVYALFDALMDRAAASGICQRLCAWIKAQHADLFVPLSF